MTLCCKDDRSTRIYSSSVVSCAMLNLSIRDKLQFISQLRSFNEKSVLNLFKHVNHDSILMF